MKWSESDSKIQTGFVLLVGGLVGLNVALGDAQHSGDRGDSAAEQEQAAADPARRAGEAVAKPGEPAPGFTLTSVFGEQFALGDAMTDGRIVVLEWLGPKCRQSAELHTSGDLHVYHDRFKSQGVQWLAICPADASDDGLLQAARRVARDWELSYPVLLDPGRRVTGSYGVEQMPQFFVINEEGTLVYSGPALPADNPRGESGGTSAMQVVEHLLNGRAFEPIADPISDGCPVQPSE